MNVLKNIKVNRILLSVVLLVFLAISVRVTFLDRVPTGMSDDELLYTLSSQAFFYTGKDVSEQWSPLSLVKPPSNVVIAYGRVPYMLFSPFLGNITPSMFTARLPYALFGGLFVIVIFFICQRLFSPQVGIIAGLVFALNPWSIFFSRTAYESPIAMYFAFMMLVLLLYVRSWKILLAFPFYILSFYSYLGTNIILPLFTLLTIFYAWLLNNKRFTKYYLALIFLTLLVFVVYIIHLPNDIGGGRTKELITPNLPTVSQSVNWDRRESIHTPFTSLFINKYINSGMMIVNQYLGAFSPMYLFSKGEGEARFTLWSHGTFYLIDILFLLIGVISLFRHKMREALLLLSIVLISPIPSALHFGDTQYALRSSFLFPVLIIFIGYGVYTVIQRFQNKAIPAVLIGIVYGIFVANFGYQYNFRNPVYNYDSFGLSGRIFARYMQLVNTHGYKAQMLYNGVDTGLFRQYLFFTKKYTKENHSQIASLFSQQSISLENITFTDCRKISLDQSVITVIPYNLKCTNQKLSKNIVSITDYTGSKPIYLIYNDLLCQKYKLLPYLNNLQLKDFAIENLNEQAFCQKFFTRDVGYNPRNATESAAPKY